MSNLTRFDNQDDFTVANGHARMRQRKVAEITRVGQSTVSKYIDALIDKQIADILSQYGFDGDSLNDFVAYLAIDAKRISPEVKTHNIKLLAKSSKLGFQVLIDKMAGIEQQQVQQNLTPTQMFAQCAQAMLDLESRLTRIEEKQIEAEKELTALPLAEESPEEIPDRGKINMIVRNKCKREGLSHAAVWGSLYLQVYYRYRYDVKARCRNSGLSKLDQIEKDGMMSKLFAIASEVLT